MGILSVIIFALFCVFFLVTLVLSAWRWRWLNIVVMVFLFPAVVTFVIMFANVMKKDYAEKEKMYKVRDSLEKQLTDNKLLLEGPDDATEWTADSITGLTHRVEKAQLGRGRVWRDCLPGTMTGSEIQVTTFVAPPGNADGTEATILPNDIKAPSLVYAFSQTPLNADGWGLPDKYLGEFRVKEATDTTVLLVENLVLDQAELKASLTSRWTLYELLPADMHGAFGYSESDPSVELSLEETRQLLVAKYLPPESMNLTEESPEYQALIARYLLDGKSVGEIKVMEGFRDFAPTDDETMIEMEFLKDYEVQIDSDVEITDLANNREFDDKGLTLDMSLKSGGTVKIKKGDRYLFDKKTAETGYVDANGTPVPSLADQGIAKPTGQYFVRELNDFGSAYRDVTLSLDLLAQELAVQEHHNEQLAISATLAAGAIAERTKVRDGLESDNTNLKKDQETVDAALAAQNERLTRISAQISSFDKAIAEATAKVEALETQWAREADEKTREAEGFGMLGP